MKKRVCDSLSLSPLPIRWRRLDEEACVWFSCLGDWFCLNKHHSLSPLPGFEVNRMSISPISPSVRSESCILYLYSLLLLRHESYKHKSYRERKSENIRLRHTLLGGRGSGGDFTLFHIVGALGDTFITLSLSIITFNKRNSLSNVNKQRLHACFFHWILEPASDLRRLILPQ